MLINFLLNVSINEIEVILFPFIPRGEHSNKETDMSGEYKIPFYRTGHCFEYLKGPKYGVYKNLSENIQ